MWVPFEEPCFLKYVASKEDPLPQQLSWVGGERKEESHLAPDNAISTQGRFLPTDVNPQLQSQLLAMTAAGLQTGSETSPYSEQENGVAHDYKNGTRPCMKQTAPYSVGANGVSALELLGLSQQEQTEPCNTNLQPRAQSGKRPMRHTERLAAKTTTSRPVGHDDRSEHTEAYAGHKDQPSGSSEDTDGVLAIADLTAPYSVGANGVAALELLGLSQQEQTEPCNTNLQPRAQSGKRPMRHTERLAAKTTTSRPVGHDDRSEHTEAYAGHKDQPSGSSEDTDGVLAIADLTAPYSVGANGVAALELLGLSQQEQTEPGNTNHPAPYSVGANGVAYVEPGHKDQPSGSSEDTDGVLAIAVLTAPYSVGANGVTSQMLSLAPATSQMLSSAPATTGITTPFFGDTGIRLLQFLVEFHPGGFPSHGLASRDEGHSAAAI